MEKRRLAMEAHEAKMARRQMVEEIKKKQGGGGQILLAYGLNKNLKQLQANAYPARAKSAKHRHNAGF